MMDVDELLRLRDEEKVHIRQEIAEMHERLANYYQQVGGG
jgi:hypothetical protein